MRRTTGALLAATLAATIAVMIGRAQSPKVSSGSSQMGQPAPEEHTNRLRVEPANESRPAPVQQTLAASSGPPFASEDDYLRALEQLSQTDKQRALELVRKGNGWYSGSGVRAEARQAMGITLLVDLGEMAEARVLTRHFIAEHPTSPYRQLVQGVTGIHPRPTGPSQKHQ